MIKEILINLIYLTRVEYKFSYYSFNFRKFNFDRYTNLMLFLSFQKIDLVTNKQLIIYVISLLFS